MIASLIARLFRSEPRRSSPAGSAGPDRHPARPGADLRAAQGGDREAIARFYDAHVDGLYTFIYYRVGRDTALAEETWLRESSERCGWRRV